VIILFFLLFTLSSAKEYYADVEIYVDESGEVLISGTTNHPLLEVEKTQEYTTKEGSLWILNITTTDTFSNFVYSVNLPKNAAINYVKAPSLRIEQTFSGISIKGLGKNREFEIIVQYRLKDESPGYDLVLLVAVLMAVTFLLYRKRRAKKPQEKTPRISPENFPERQRKILKIIIREGSTTQAKLLQELKIPKSSLSRNVKSLVRQGIIISERKGMSNFLKLK